MVYRSEGVAERDMESLRMMGWGLATAESCSVDGCGVLRVGTHRVMVVVGYDYSIQGYDYYIIIYIQ